MVVQSVIYENILYFNLCNQSKALLESMALEHSRVMGSNKDTWHTSTATVRFCDKHQHA